MKLRLSERAESDYDAIERYTVETHGVRQWLIYSGQLEQGFLTLRHFSQIGLVDRRLPRGHQAFKVGHHWICYEIDEDFILIKAIVRELDHFENPPIGRE